jgi:hypothetical protein
MAANLTIQFTVDPETGERTIVVRYRSDPDALPQEHEEEHRALVEQLVEGGLIPAAEAGRVRIEREPAAARDGDTHATAELGTRRGVASGEGGGA